MLLRDMLKERLGQPSEHTKVDEVNILNQIQGDLQGYNCELCRNKGYVYEDREGEIVAVPCKCKEMRAFYRRMEKSGIRNLLEKYKFNNFQTEKDYQKMMKSLAWDFCCQDEKFFFFVGGQSGSGKTHICTAIVGYLLRKGKACRYMLWRDESSAIKAVANLPDYSVKLAELKNAEVLYIDDLFKSQAGRAPTAGDINLCFEVLNYRYNNKLMTVLSSEFNLSDIINFDEAIGSRISESAGRYVINLKKDSAKNYRLR